MKGDSTGVGFALLILSNFHLISHGNEIIWSHCDQFISFSQDI